MQKCWNCARPNSTAEGRRRRKCQVRRIQGRAEYRCFSDSQRTSSNTADELHKDDDGRTPQPFDTALTDEVGNRTIRRGSSRSSVSTNSLCHRWITIARECSWTASWLSPRCNCDMPECEWAFLGPRAVLECHDPVNYDALNDAEIHVVVWA